MPAQVSESGAQAVWDTLNRMTIGKTDPLFAQALREAGTTLGAATGRNPLTGQNVFPGFRGLDASIAQAASEAGRAADGATQLSQGAREAANGASRLSNGANELHDGLVRLERGNERLQRGLADLAEGSDELRDGLARLGVGQDQLASGLESGHAESAPLEAGLADAAAEVGLTRDQLVGRSGPFKPLRTLAALQKRSPRFFSSGYVPVAAFDGARALDRDASTFLLDSDRGGGQVGRVSILPDVETNDPRTDGRGRRREEGDRGLRARERDGRGGRRDRGQDGRVRPRHVRAASAAGRDDLPGHLPAAGGRSCAPCSYRRSRCCSTS